MVTGDTSKTPNRPGFCWVVLLLRPQVPKRKKPLFSHSRANEAMFDDVR